jgi:hypothetical protein
MLLYNVLALAALFLRVSAAPTTNTDAAVKRATDCPSGTTQSLLGIFVPAQCHFEATRKAFGKYHIANNRRRLSDITLKVPVFAHPGTTNDDGANAALEEYVSELKSMLASMNNLDWKNPRTYTTDADGVSQVEPAKMSAVITAFFTVRLFVLGYTCLTPNAHTQG